MARKLARIVRIDALSVIPKADLIETAHVGGWTVVVKKGEFAAGDLAVYFEIDSFLPQGNPAWDFLVQKVPFDYRGVTGHVLRSVQMRGQVSQGLLLPLSALAGTPAQSQATVGTEVTRELGVTKYEKPLPADLEGKARGYFPGLVPKTDEERIQNLTEELGALLAEHGSVTVEVSEKLEGTSCTFAVLDGELHVCSREVDYLEDAQNPMWKLARELDIEAKLKARFGNVALQGELVGPGIEGNHYELTKHEFRLFRVYLVESGRWMTPTERRSLAAELGIGHVPVVAEALVLDETTSAQTLLAMADGASQLNPKKRREGLVFKSGAPAFSFKAVSNAYLLNTKL
ncbi:RNA ligase [compost metagenome]